MKIDTTILNEAQRLAKDKDEERKRLMTHNPLPLLNEENNKILKEHHDKMMEIASDPKIAQLQPVFREERLETTKDGVYQETLKKLERRGKEFNTEAEKIRGEIKNIISPGFDALSERQFASSEYSNALQIAASKPQNIVALLSKALNEQNRVLFVFQVIESISNDGNASLGYKRKVEDLADGFYEKLGVKDLQIKLKDTNDQIFHLEKFLNLSLKSFEAKVNHSIRAAVGMENAGVQSGSVLTREITSDEMADR